MARAKKYATALVSGYALSIAGAMFGLLGIRVATAHLSVDEYGVYAAALQAGGFLSLLELGMGSTVARFLVDHKEERGSREYGEVFGGAIAVGLFQGMAILAISYFFRGDIAGLMNIPAEVRPYFITLLLTFSATGAAGVATGALSHSLYAHQRADVINLIGLLSQVVQFGILWLLLSRGWGLSSYVPSAICGCLVSMVLIFTAAWRLRLLPPPGNLRFSISRTREMLTFSAGVFGIMLGNQVVSFAPTLLLSRFAGMEAVAAWNIGMRIPVFLSQLVSRIASAAEPAFWEMYVRGEMETIRTRFVQVVAASFSLAAAGAALVVVANGEFIGFWTHGKVSWSPTFDLLAGVWIIFIAGMAAFNQVAGIARKIGFYPLICLGEGLTLIAISGTTMLHSVAGILILQTVLFFAWRGLYGIGRSVRDLGLPLHAWWPELGRIAATATALLALGAAIRCGVPLLPWSRAMQFAAAAAILAAVVLPVWLLLGLPKAISEQIPTYARRLASALRSGFQP